MKNYDPEIHQRRSIRKHGFDYASLGGYFVTVCTHNRQSFFGAIANARMHLSEYGRVVENEWLRTSAIRSEVQLDEFIVMPDHFHAIVFISAEQAQPLDRKPRALGSLIGRFKSAVALQINRTRNTPGFPVWQRNYYERIIRSSDELMRIREYIINNPAQWNRNREMEPHP